MTTTATDWVLDGRPVQDSGGELPPPRQVNSSGMVAPSANAVLVTVIEARADVLADVSAGAPARSSRPVQPAEPVARVSIARTAVAVLVRGTLHGTKEGGRPDGHPPSLRIVLYWTGCASRRGSTQPGRTKWQVYP